MGKQASQQAESSVNSQDGRFNQSEVIKLLAILPSKSKASSSVVFVRPVSLTFEIFCSICLVVSKQRQRRADCLYCK